MTARETVLAVATVVTGIGLVLVLWWEMTGAAERRRGSMGRDVIEVLLPVLAAVILVAAVWMY